MISGGCTWNHGNSFNTMNEGDSNSTSTDERSLKMAFIDPTFTFAAYDKSFYLFYAMNDKTSDKYSNITEDVDLFSSIVPGNYEHFIETDEVMEHLKWLIPKSNIERLTDQDVDAGSIFRNGANKYDIIVLGHQEYVTQNEYDNFKKFVANGGTLIILTGNVFYTEVKYNKQTNSITLVEGHGFQFDGKSAQKGVDERWENETKGWLGSNFYPIYYWEKDYHHLYNNPFNFTGEGGGEEQYYDKTNHNIRILLDYNSSDPKYPIATYELKYGKGKVIVIGLAAEDILDPCLEGCHKFYKMIDKLLVNNAIPSYRFNK